MAQLESKVESALALALHNVKSACAKFKGTVRGEPDRLVSFPDRYHCLVETKWKAGIEPQPHQLRRHAWWRLRGMDVFVIRSPEEVTLFMVKMRKHYTRD
jgi:hypothetical protein